MTKRFFTPIAVPTCCVPAFPQTGGGILGAANAMPEANYSFAPVVEEMTFIKWVAPIADAQTGTCPALETINSGPAQSSHAGALAGVVVHENECYGSMAVYLRDQWPVGAQ
jgi:hypothetical protein